MNPTGDISFRTITSTISNIEEPAIIGSSQNIPSQISVTKTSASMDIVSLSPEVEESQKIASWVNELRAMPELNKAELRSIAHTLESQMVSSQVISSIAEKIGEELYYLN